MRQWTKLQNADERFGKFYKQIFGKIKIKNVRQEHPLVTKKKLNTSQ